MTEMLLTSTAPLFRVDGDTKGALARDLLDLSIVHSTMGLATLEATFQASGPGGDDSARLAYLDGSVVDFGKEIQVSLGATRQETVVFTGTVSAIEARFSDHLTPRVVVFAEDALGKFRLTRRTRTYENCSDADIARQLADEHGLIADCTAEGPTYDRVQQWQQSDLAFLRDRARLIQAEIWVDDDGLHFASRSQRNANDVELAESRDLMSADLRADLAHQRTSVVVSGYDANSREVINEEVGTEVVQAEVSSGRTGPDILRAALGDHAATRARDVPLTSGEAQAWGKAEMLRRARQFVTARVMTNGSPELMVGSKVTLDGVGKPFEGDGYYCTRVVHTYDLDNGHRTHANLERATVRA
jgi:phage protein D